MLHQTHQKLLDMKDKELEDFSYRLRTVTSTQQKDLEKLHQSHRAKVAELEEIGRKREEELKSKAMEMRWLEVEVEGNEVRPSIILNANFYRTITKRLILIID